MPNNWLADKSVVVRIPLLPQSGFAEWTNASGGNIEQLRAGLRDLLDSPQVQDALFVASPALVHSIEHWLREPDTARGQKIERALVRYVTRMAARATPFGLFSGVAVAKLADTTGLEVGARSDYGRRTRLDNDYLFALCEALGRDPSIRRELRYRPNSSMYRAAGRLRYAEARLSGKSRSHHLVAVESTEYLDLILERARDGAAPANLAATLVRDDPELEFEEAIAYIDELVDTQILVSDLTPAVTGPEPIDGVIDVLRDVPASAEAATILRDTRTAMESIDCGGIGALPASYRAIASRLETMPAPVELARLFQVDALAPLTTATVGPRVVAEIVRGIDLLHAMAPSATESPMTRFRDAFSSRYGGREVPLVEALDEESGIGFDAPHSPTVEAAPLLAGLRFPAAPGVALSPRGRRDEFLLRRVIELAGSGEQVLELTKSDLESLETDGTPPALPDALSALVTLVAKSAADVDRGEFQLVMAGAIGPSGARLSGRFCHASEFIHNSVLEHLRAEEAQRPSAIFAEIAHLPEGRIGNVLCRPILRQYEIPFLGRSGAPRDHQLSLDDLTLSVQGDRVILRSTRLEKEVVPRLTTAHNYSASGLGIYRFLCTLQTQDSGGLGWSWGALASAPFLPRVTCGKLVFSRARWLLSKQDLAPLFRATQGAKSATTPDAIREQRSRVFAAVQIMRVQRDLPRFVVLGDGDNELLIDFDNALSVDSFAHLVRSRPSVTLIEQYPNNNQLVATGSDGRYAHELVVALTRDQTSVAPANTAAPTSSVTPASRSFAPGSDWLYAKVYCGIAVADEVLVGLAPVIRSALQSEHTDRWFFIRYADPKPHLRLRFHGAATALTSELLPALHHSLLPMVSAGCVWRLQLDTYERELERYGGSAGIELAEQLFHIDSESALEIIELLDGDEGHDARWRLALRGVDMLLDDFGLDLDAKLALARRSREQFDREFHADSSLHKQLGVTYRAQRKSLLDLLDRHPATDSTIALAPGIAALTRRSQRHADVIARLRACDARRNLAPPLPEIIWSYLHMHCNRLLRSAHRAQEMVIYDLLRRHYEAQRARR